MCQEYSIHVKGDKMHTNFSSENFKRIYYFEEIGVDCRIILK